MNHGEEGAKMTKEEKDTQDWFGQEEEDAELY
jgi:hypothetical protein